MVIARPPVVVGVNAARIVVAPVCVVEPSVNTPAVLIVFSSSFDSSSVFGVVSDNVLPRSIALPAVMLLSVTAFAPVASVWIVPPVSAILSDVSVIAPVALLTASAV